MRYDSVQNAEFHLFCSENRNFLKKSRPVIFTPPLRRRNKRYTSGTVHEHDVSGRLS